MENLLKGIYLFFTAAPGGTNNAFYTAVGGRLYLGQALEEAAFPYCVYSLVSASPDYWFDNERFENATIQFSIFSENRAPTEVSDAYQKLIALYDDAATTVTGYTVYEFEREGQWLLRDPGPARWQYVVQYNVLILKT